MRPDDVADAGMRRVVLEEAYFGDNDHAWSSNAFKSDCV